MHQSISPNRVELDSVVYESESSTPNHRGPGRRLWGRVRRDLTGLGPDQYTPLRIASHLGLFFVVVGLLVLSRVELPKWEISQPVVLPAPLPSPTPVTLSQLAIARGGSSVKPGGPLTRAAVPFTTIPERPRLDIEIYSVQPGDTVFGIAEKFGIQPETIMWANRDLELNPDLLRVNDELVILPINGVYHQVKAGDTLASIAQKYKVQPADISNYAWNGLGSAEQILQTGAYLIVPGGEKPFIPRTVNVYNGPIPEGAAKGSGSFSWPSSGSLTQQFWNSHRAIDIGGWIGSPAVASDSGFVVYAGWDRTGYGNLVVLDHGNGYRTYYAHLSKILVREGESVGKGQRIGSVGNSGNSTGPHLHFELRYNNVLRNPIGFLN